MLPNFLVIAPPKTGSTSLHRYLEAHPEVFMSEQKELRFFIEQRNWNRGLAWYERHFRNAAGAKAVGEASPGYALYPLYQGVPERIASVLGTRCRFLYVVRNPVDRIRSHYL